MSNEMLNENACDGLTAYAVSFDWLNIVNIDTLIGVVIGGILAIFGSYWVNKREYRLDRELDRAT